MLEKANNYTDKSRYKNNFRANDVPGKFEFADVLKGRFGDLAVPLGPRTLSD